MRRSNLYILYIAVIYLISGFTMADNIQVKQIVSDSQILNYINNQRDLHNSDSMKLKNARQGKFPEINEEILSRLGWQELMQSTRNENTDAEINRIITRFFSWDASYIDRLNRMQETYDVFKKVTNYNNSLEDFLRNWHRWQLRHDSVAERKSNPMNDWKPMMVEINTLQFKHFTKLNHEGSENYSGEKQGLAITGLIGYMIGNIINDLGRTPAKGTPDSKKWSQMLVQSSLDVLTGIPEALAEAERVLEQETERARKDLLDRAGKRISQRNDGNAVEAAKALYSFQMLEPPARLPANRIAAEATDALSSWLQPVISRQAYYESDIARLVSARHGENEQVSSALLNKYGWETLTLIKDNHWLVDKAIQEVFDWEASYIHRLSIMKMAFDTFTRITVDFPETVEVLLKKYPHKRDDEILNYDKIWLKPDPKNPYQSLQIINPARELFKHHIDDNKLLSEAFFEFDHMNVDNPYDGQGLDQLTLGLIGYMVEWQLQSSDKKGSSNQWQKLILERFYDALTPLMNEY